MICQKLTRRMMFHHCLHYRLQLLGNSVDLCCIDEDDTKHRLVPISHQLQHCRCAAAVNHRIGREYNRYLESMQDLTQWLGGMGEEMEQRQAQEKRRYEN